VDVRILGVCDVYDALISPRVYRPAWTHEDAIGLLQDRAAFDPRCVKALEDVLAREGGPAPEPERQSRRSCRIAVAPA
jgi:HD-GYP domain-containing protein (c-di-GMP phosphodiesterase class II)